MLDITRDEHRSRYTCISNHILRDERLSLAAKGLFAIILSLPDDWEFTVRGTAVMLGISDAAVRRCLRELQQNGYVTFMQKKLGNGKFSMNDYHFTETPLSAEPHTDEPRADLPCTDEPYAENVPQLNKDKSNKDIKQNKDHQPREENELSFSEAQINADALRGEYGEECIDSVISAITDCNNVGRLTVCGRNVGRTELQGVLARVGEADIRAVLQQMEGKQEIMSFRRYFMALLYDRMTSPVVRAKKTDDCFGNPSSFDCDEVMREVMAKYR